MSINVYLQGEEVMKIDGFKISLREERGQSWEEYSLPGIKLWYDKGRWHIILHYPTEPIPPAVADIVDEISFHDWLYGCPEREAGVYRYESAEAEVAYDKISGERALRIRIIAETMPDLLDLFRNIREGSIRPEVSYEGEQTGLSRSEIEAELAEAQASLDDKDDILAEDRLAFDQLRISRESLCAKSEARMKVIRDFRSAYNLPSWPPWKKSKAMADAMKASHDVIDSA